MDTLTARQRSDVMSRIRGKDTKPEMRVRRLVHAMGYRYRLHVKDLPGCPDLVFRPRRKVIFIHGCFWHRHEDCPSNRIPATHRKFWQAKLDGNVQRDRRNETTLRESGWHVLVLWECETGDINRVAHRLRSFLDSPDAGEYGEPPDEQQRESGPSHVRGPSLR